jgi:hypothetical protein
MKHNAGNARISARSVHTFNQSNRHSPSFTMCWRTGAHQGYWEPLYPRKIADFKQGIGYQISRRTLRKLCSQYLTWACLPASFLHFFFAMSDNNIDPVMIRSIWWWLRRRKRRRREKRKHWVHPFFRDNLISGAYIVLKELNQDPELFKPFYRMSIEKFSLLVYLVGPQIRRQDTNFRTAVSAEPQAKLQFCIF